MDTFISFVGHLHPLVVHFPIGILILAIVLECWNKWRHPSEARQSMTQLALAIGAIGSIGAVITGWFLANEGDYSDTLLFQHRWLGIGTAVLAVGAWYWYAHRKHALIMVAMTLTLFITLHLGSTMTHGSGYLFQSNTPIAAVAVNTDTLLKKDQTLVFLIHIAPILNQKCVGCHRTGKTKGKLNLESAESLLKGGKSGSAIVVKYPESSELYRRITADLQSEKHMPPKNKPQLDPKEVEIIGRWIEQGGMLGNE